MSILSTIVVGSGSGNFVHALVFLFVIAIVLGMLLWLVDTIPLIPDGFKKVLTWLIYLVEALILINFLLSIVGYGFLVIN